MLKHFPRNRFAGLDLDKLMRDARFQAADENGMIGFDYDKQKNLDFSVSKICPKLCAVCWRI
ncbi:Uncharacterised protein [Kingella potus]|uniref:Uncharacterized protein n=1 Tax=Kingella potus TaxID=265175 RepID=A0A377R0Q5_9NEIS|nr:hypothetical protein [Kingella potus]UOP01127.1 hypothetical protein LVJ84_02015 [Kingella potus]STR00832.1 Uncharacterised protein [Kingella potus]